MKTCSIEGCNKKHDVKGLCRKHYNKQYWKDNKEKISKQQRRYNQDHKEEIIKYYQDNKESFKQYYQNNKESITKYDKQWRQTLAGKASQKASNHKSRLLTKDLTIKIIQRVYEANIKKYGILTCYLCEKPIINNDDSLEHSTPVSRGGSNNYENFGIAHQSCNSKKGTKTLEEWNALKINP